MVLTAQDYAELSALYDELTELDAQASAQRLRSLIDGGHRLSAPLRRMLAMRQAPRTADLLERLKPLQEPVARYTPGQRIGPWRLLQVLGSGGMAEVWLARREDGGLKREVALKLPFALPGAAGSTRIQRFARERDILARLRHPHIAALLDAGVEPDGQTWLALERVDGQRITEWCDAHRSTVPERIALFRQILLAVRQAHAQLVIHRDLKPGNVLVTTHGEVRLLDFGIAKLLDEGSTHTDDTELTQRAGRPLTPRYASPEQWRGEPLSTASDVYALGVLLHELLLGSLPYTLAHDSPAELERAILERDVPVPSRALVSEAVAQARATTPRALARTLAPELDAVMLRALAKQPEGRYGSVDALLDDIDRWCQGVPVRARTPTVWFRLGRFVSRHRMGVGVGVGLACTLVSLSVTAVLYALQARQQSERAASSRDFLLGVFGMANQEASRGAETSAREMLDWGRRRASALSARPEVRADLLLDIARAQTEASDYAGAEVTYQDAVSLLHPLGRREDETLAHLARAELAVRVGNLDRAAQALAQAREARRPDAGPAVQARDAQMEGLLLRMKGRATEAVAPYERAAAAAARAWPPGFNDRIQIEVQQARALAAAGQAARALALLEALLARLTDVGYEDALQIANIQFYAGVVETEMGRYASAAERSDGALQRCVKVIGVASEVCAKLRQQLVTVLLRQGRAAPAGTLLDDVRREIPVVTDPRRRAYALAFSGRILAAQDHIEPDHSPWPELRQLAQGPSDPPVPEALRVLALQTLAEAALHQGQATQAAGWLSESQRRLAGHGSDLGPTLALRQGLLEGAAAWMAGQPAEALTAWRRTRDAAAQALGEDHPMTWLCAAHMVPSLQAAGRREEARQLLQRALPVLHTALGPASPVFQRVAGWQREPGVAIPASTLVLML